ncbi:protein of unknown function [Pararobbsia alpina]
MRLEIALSEPTPFGPPSLMPGFIPSPTDTRGTLRASSARLARHTCSQCRSNASNEPLRPILPVDPGTRCLIDWDARENRLVNVSLCGLSDKNGNRLVHHAEFQASAVVREWSSKTFRAPDKATIIRALIKHSDLDAVNCYGQNPLHTHALYSVRTANFAFFDALYVLRPDRLADLLRARDHDGNTVLNAASSWTVDEDACLNFDLGLVRLLTGPFAHIDTNIRDALRCTAIVPNDLAMTPLKQYMSLIATPADIHAGYLEWLMDAGADPHTTDNCGRTLLHVFAETSTHAVDLSSLSRRAIEAGVHPAQLDDFGQTALHSAASNEWCSAELIQLLVRHCTGFDPFTLKNCDGHTPIAVAKACGYHRVAHLIASACMPKTSA